MDTSLLPRLRARVEAGEPLETQELDALGRATARRPGERAWLACFAKALINSDKAQEAVVLLNAALEATPADAGLHVVRARALLALGRGGEAEADLETALRLNPGEPEALRVRAAVAAGGAIDWVDEPVEDCEGPLGAELSGFGADDEVVGPDDDADRAPSSTCLCAALSALGLEARVEEIGDAVHVKVLRGPGDGRAPVRGLLLANRARARGDVWATARRFAELARRLRPGGAPTAAAGAVALGSPAGFEAVRDQIFPLLRTAAFLERIGPALHSPAGPPGLVWTYVVDEGEFLRLLEPDFLGSSGSVNAEAIAAAAFANLDRDATPPARYRIGHGGLVPLDADDEATGWDLLAWERGDGFDASRPLAPRHRAALEALHQGPWAVAVPVSAFCLLAPLENPEAVVLLSAIARGECVGRHGLSAEICCLRDGVLESWQEHRN